jgi:hypothetical protein
MFWFNFIIIKAIKEGENNRVIEYKSEQKKRGENKKAEGRNEMV